MNKKHDETNCRQSSSVIVQIYRDMDNIKVEEMSTLNWDLLIDKWLQNMAAHNNLIIIPECGDERRFQHPQQDAMFFSSTPTPTPTSMSFDFSPTVLDTNNSFTTPSCFTMFRPNPIPLQKTEAKQRQSREKTEAKQRQSREKTEAKQRQNREKTDTKQRNETKESSNVDERGLMKSKSRKGLKIFNNLNEGKQPISPGRRLSRFLRSILTTGNSNKTKNSTVMPVGTTEELNTERISFPTPTSCLRNRECSRPKLRPGDTRTIRFYPEVDNAQTSKAVPRNFFNLEDGRFDPITLLGGRTLPFCGF